MSSLKDFQLPTGLNSGAPHARVPEFERLMGKGLKVLQAVDVQDATRFCFRRKITHPCGHSEEARLGVLIPNTDIASVTRAELATRVEIEADAAFAVRRCPECSA